MQKHLLLALLVCAAARALDSGDNKFIKEYALLKIYESCFGATLLQQIAKELSDAYVKCSATPSMPEPPKPPMQPMFLDRLPPGFPMDLNTQSLNKPIDGAIGNQENDNTKQDQPVKPLGGVLAFRPPGNQFPQPGISPFMMPTTPQFRFYGPTAPIYQFPYSGYMPQVPYNPYYPPYQQVYQQPYFGSSRMSRQMGFRGRIGFKLPRGPNGYNVTCVMREIDYIDQNYEPNYESIRQRVNRLPVSDDLKSNIQDGLQFCQKFSQCIPEENRGMKPHTQDQIRSSFFFRCYKHKKLEAKHSRSSRSIRDTPLRDPSMEALEEMEVYLYDYLSGVGAFDFDLYI
ncbi:hypothetical protein O3G_MSEX005274 [Manduca sexta]|uniref:Uncharacterized protein n=1 Tax=Manduca sexta TaxID=7130 RepID=A0A922CJ44_MANSE|nr:hypothetical protein O3G_MSEX005274 [Manduca sexta]